MLILESQINEALGGLRERYASVYKRHRSGNLWQRIDHDAPEKFGQLSHRAREQPRPRSRCDERKEGFAVSGLHDDVRRASSLTECPF